MKRLVTILVVSALGVGLAVPASASAAPDRTFVRYAKIRDILIGCSLDRGWRHLGPTKRRQCTRYRRRYVLYSFYGHPGFSFYYCRTSRCPARPIGVPDPRRRPPRDAVIFR